VWLYDALMWESRISSCSGRETWGACLDTTCTFYGCSFLFPGIESYSVNLKDGDRAAHPFSGLCLLGSG